MNGGRLPRGPRIKSSVCEWDLGRRFAFRDELGARAIRSYAVPGSCLAKDNNKKVSRTPVADMSPMSDDSRQQMHGATSEHSMLKIGKPVLSRLQREVRSRGIRIQSMGNNRGRSQSFSMTPFRACAQTLIKHQGWTGVVAVQRSAAGSLAWRISGATD